MNGKQRILSSDGFRAVLFFGERPHGLYEIDFLEWQMPSRSKTRIEGLKEYFSEQDKKGD